LKRQTGWKNGGRQGTALAERSRYAPTVTRLCAQKDIVTVAGRNSWKKNYWKETAVGDHMEAGPVYCVPTAIPIEGTYYFIATELIAFTITQKRVESHLEKTILRQPI
jgi:hypothetical protein